MKKIILLILLCVLMISCTHSFELKECDYCKDMIHYHLIRKTLTGESYKNNATRYNGKIYHTWCLKFKTDLDKRK